MGRYITLGKFKFLIHYSNTIALVKRSMTPTFQFYMIKVRERIFNFECHGITLRTLANTSKRICHF